MRAFVLLCFMAAVTAQYSYEPPDTGHSVGGLTGSTIDKLTEPIQPVVEEYNKSFYTYIAPEQDFEDTSAAEHIEKSIKRSLRIIFIKGPENTSLENAFLKLAKSAADDRTAIYVLNKQTDIGDLANQVQQLKINSGIKPDVNFIKYRTQADAENAQRAIQAQYNNIPGVTTNNEASSAPVLNFASKSVEAPTINNAATSARVAAPTTSPRRSYVSSRGSYLPPSKRI